MFYTHVYSQSLVEEGLNWNGKMLAFELSITFILFDKKFQTNEKILISKHSTRNLIKITCLYKLKAVGSLIKLNI